jgi:hypothetical protein
VKLSIIEIKLIKTIEKLTFAHKKGTALYNDRFHNLVAQYYLGHGIE